MKKRKRTRCETPLQRAVAYVRVSTDEQELGPAAQRSTIETWASAEGVEVVEVLEDVGVSGATPVEKRPALTEALAAISEGRASILVVAKRDRLARDVMVSAMVTRLVERHGGRVVSANGVGNEEGESGFLVRGIVDLFAAYERMVIRSRTAQALAVKRRAGERVGSIPYGYRLDADGVRLRIHRREQKTVRRARALREEGLSFRAIAAILDEEGHKPRGGKRFHPQTVSNMVSAEPIEGAA